MTHAADIAEKKYISDHLLFFLRNKQGTIAAAAVLLLYGIVVFGNSLGQSQCFDDDKLHGSHHPFDVFGNGRKTRDRSG